MCLEHPEENIIKFCLNENCQVNRLIYAWCVQKHEAHNYQLDNQLIHINEASQPISLLLAACEKILDNYDIQIQEIFESLKEIQIVIINKQKVVEEHFLQEINLFDSKKCINHKNKITNICVNKTCASNKYVCHSCLKNHKDHSFYLLDKGRYSNYCEKSLQRLQSKVNQRKLNIDLLVLKLNSLKDNLYEQYEITLKEFFQLGNSELSLKFNQLQNFPQNNN